MRPSVALEIESDRVVVRLPDDSSTVRITAVAAYLGRLS